MRIFNFSLKNTDLKIVHVATYILKFLTNKSNSHKKKIARS